jgi:hypothetical protein
MRCTLPSNCTLAESALAAVFRYFVVRSFGKHLATYAALFCGRHPARLVCRAVRITLHPDIFCWRGAAAAPAPHHALTRGRLQTSQQRI